MNKKNRIGVTIGAENEYSKELKAAKKDFLGFNKDIAAGFMVSAKTAAIAAAAVVGAGTALFALTSKYASAGDALGNFNERIGVGVEALSEWQYIADISGISAETLNMAWQRMTRRLAEAAVGTGEAQGAIQELGLSAVELAQLAPEDQFDAIAKALSGVKDKSQQVRLAMKFFDSEGVAVLQTLGNIERGKKGVRESGQIWTAEEVALAQEFSVTSKEASGALSGLGKSISIELMPGFTSLLNGVTDFINNNPAFNSAIDLTTKAVKGLGSMFGLDTYENLEKIGALREKIATQELSEAQNRKIFEEENNKRLQIGVGWNNRLLKMAAANLKSLTDNRKELKGLEIAYIAAHTEAEKTKKEQTNSTKTLTAEEKKKIAAEKVAATTLNTLRIATAKLGATQEEIIKIDAAEFEQRGASAEQVREYIRLLGLKRDKEKEIADQKETDRQREAAAKGLAGIGDAPGVLTGANAPEQFAEAIAMQENLLAIKAHYAEKAVAIAAMGGDQETALVALKNEEILVTEKQTAQMRMSMAAGTFGMMSNMMQNLTVLTGKEGGAAFEAMKVFAVAEALVKAKQSVVDAYEFGNKFGGPVLGAAFAAAAGIATAAQIQDITSIKPGSSSTNTTISPGGTANPSYSGGSPSAYPVPERIDQTRERPAIVFKVEKIELLGDDSVDRLMERINDRVKDFDVELIATETVPV